MNFSKQIDDYWNKVLAGPVILHTDRFSISVNENVGTKRPAMIMTAYKGPTRAVIHPEVVKRLGSRHKENQSIAAIQRDLNDAGVLLHDPDYLYYLPMHARSAAHSSPANIRELFESDRYYFDLFQCAVSEQDREDAAVELEHWTVAGCFDENQLVSVASMCLWKDSPITDIGVLTLPDARGKGFATAVVRFINSLAIERGFEPQYRCQTQNHASVALARSCEFRLYGEWIVAFDAN